MNGSPTAAAAAAMHPSEPFRAVYFDCDSTLSAIEGVDELLRWAPAALRAELLALTDQAMNGTLPLAEVYGARLARLSPRREQLQQVGELYVRHLVPGAAEVTALLHQLGKEVGIISGGLSIPVQHVARRLGIKPENVHAVALQFDGDGAYVDYDRSSPLTRNGGKVTVIASLPPTQHPLAFVGDGITDLETQGHVERFIGFGGVVARPAVQRGAECWAADDNLAAVLPFLLTRDEHAAASAEPRWSRLLSPRRP